MNWTYGPLPAIVASMPRLVLAFLVFTLTPVANASEPTLHAVIDSLQRPLPTATRTTLERIDGEGRRLLALRSYLKNAPSLAARWSWTSEEIAAYQTSPEYRRALEEIAQVTRVFEMRNPGYTLHVNAQVRSLDLQLERWNSNRTVQHAALALEQAMRAKLAESDHQEKALRIEAWRQFIVDWYPPQPVSLAAPGLSAHGQLRAFDFQIRQGERIFAGPNVDSVGVVWDRGGWTSRLNEAITTGSRHFNGPLASPREPWHYEYHP